MENKRAYYKFENNDFASINYFMNYFLNKHPKCTMEQAVALAENDPEFTITKTEKNGGLEYRIKINNLTVN
jgi:hypothetical protein